MALRELGGFDAMAGLQNLRSTLTDVIHTKRPGITLIATTETWLVTGGFSQAELEALMLASQGLADAGERNSFLAVLFEQLATLNPRRALELVRQLPPESTGRTVTMMLEFWVTRDVAAAREWYALSVEGRASEFPDEVKVFGSLAEVQPVTPPGPAGIADAMVAYHEIRSKAERGRWSSTEAGPVVKWAQQTGQWAVAIHAAGNDSSLRGYLHNLWAGMNPVEWLAWMRDHPQEGKGGNDGGKDSGMERRNLLVRGLSMINFQFPPQKPSHEVGAHLDTLLAMLAEEGADFTSENGPVRSALESSFPQWLERQPTKASEWVKRHQKDPWIEPLVALLATNVAKDDPLAALAWAGAIKDDTLRRRTSAQVHATWRTHDPAAADAWASEHPAEPGQ